MSYFAAVLARSDDAWRAVEVDLDDCESLDDVIDLARDVSGDLVADELDEIGEDILDGDEDAPPAHDSAPFGDASVVADLGTSSGELLELCAHEGTLPIDLIVAVCEKAGCADAFEALRV
jgi:hypothetical protein